MTLSEHQREALDRLARSSKPVAPKRVRMLGNLYRPRVPESAVYVGRGTPWGNPFRVKVHGRERALELFREYLRGRPELVERARRELAGQDVACWCQPGEDCHADVWLAVVAGQRP